MAKNWITIVLNWTVSFFVIGHYINKTKVNCLLIILLTFYYHLYKLNIQNEFFPIYQCVLEIICSSISFKLLK